MQDVYSYSLFVIRSVVINNFNIPNIEPPRPTPTPLPNVKTLKGVTNVKHVSLKVFP